MIFSTMDASTSVHTGSAGQHKLKQQNVQGNQENTGSQGAIVAVLAALCESLAKRACEKLTKKSGKKAI